MTPVDMIHFHTEASGSIPGDCFRACVASLFDLPALTVPHFVADPRGEHCWMHAVNEWADARDMFYTIFRDDPIVPPKGGALVIASGKSPRGDFGHSVICHLDYGPLRLIHDPHPSRAGIVGPPRSFGIFVRKFCLPNPSDDLPPASGGPVNRVVGGPK